MHQATNHYPSIDPVWLTRQLCEIDSTTFHEGAVGDYLEKYLKQCGWSVEKTPIPQPEDGADGPRWNIYAAVSAKTPEVVFSTHIDTVPPYIPVREDEEYICGRGVCDAKGIMAAQIAAAQQLRAEGCNVGLLFVSGEERDTAGAMEANLHPKGARFLINGEPTGNRLATASKGSLRFTLKTTGKMAHSAYPELGESAIHKLIGLLDRFLAVEWPQDEFAGDTTLNIGLLRGGHAPNVVADHAEAQVLIRLVTDSQPIREKVLELAEGVAKVIFTLDIPFVRTKTIAGLPTMIAKFSTDIPKLTNWGEPLLCGPGSIHVAHSPDERVLKRELKDAVGIYVRIVHQLLTQ